MRHDVRGQSAVEMLLGTLLFVTLIFGGLELARAVSLKQALERGAFEGVRYWAIKGDQVGAEGVVRAAVGQAILGGDPATVELDFAGSAWGPTRYGDTVCISLLYPLRLDLPLVAVGVKYLSATQCTLYEVYP